MQSKPDRAVDEPLSTGDRLIFWLFVAGMVACAALGVWALFFKE